MRQAKYKLLKLTTLPIAKIKQIIEWRRDNHKDAPATIYFFKDAINKVNRPRNKEEQVKGMIKKITRKLKMRY